MSKTSRPFHKRGQIVLTSDPEGELSAPFYPLPTSIRILQITQRGVEVDLDPNWEGFTTCEGKIEDINSNRKSAYTHIMKKGDYGSIAYNDLRVLIRIGKERQTQRQMIGHSKEYRGQFLEFWLGDRRDFKFLVFGSLASAWVIGSFVMGLLKHPDDRPQSFIELRNEYTLPFIHPQHLTHAPESLQLRYDRQTPLHSVLNFAHELTNTLLDLQPPSNEKESVSKTPIFAETKLRYQRLYARQKQDLEALAQKRLDIERRILSDQRNALIAIPSIKGETFAGSLLRLEDKLSIWYLNTNKALQYRREMSESFRQDALYSYTEYKEPGRVKRGDYEAGSNPKDESFLYKDASDLALLADQHRKQIVKFREPATALSVENSSPLALPLDNQFSSTAKPENFAAFNLKLGLIQASLFNPDKPKIIREPLIGTLDPQLVQATIDRYRFELQLCYELALRRNQEAQGSMQWQWHIDTQGQVFDIELVQTSISDSKMADCVRNKIASWKWPKPQKGSIQISFPFHFNPSKG